MPVNCKRILVNFDKTVIVFMCAIVTNHHIIVANICRFAFTTKNESSELFNRFDRSKNPHMKVAA